MIAAWMIYVAAVSALIACAAWVADHGLAAIRKPRRYVWLGALLVATVVAGARLSIEKYRFSDAPTTEVVTSDAGPGARGLPPVSAPTGRTGAPGSSRSPGSIALLPPTLEVPATFDALDTPLLALWLAGSLGWAVLLAASALRIHRRHAEWKPEILDGVPVYVSHDVGPALVGIGRYGIVVPAWVRELPAARRKLILAHEREHARAGDPLVLLAGALVVLTQPFNVAAWAMFRRLRLAIEADCDARVLMEAPDARAYGELLLDVTERMLPGAAPVAALSEPHSHLARRIALMTPRPLSRPVTRSLAALGAAFVLVLGACQLPRPTVQRQALITPDMDFIQYRWVASEGRQGPRTYTDPATGQPLLLGDSVALDMGGIDGARVIPFAGPTGEPTAAVMVSLNPTGAARFAAATATHAGRQVAVVIDGRVATTAVVESSLGPTIPLLTDVSRAVADSIARRVNQVAATLRPLAPVHFERNTTAGTREPRIR